MRRASLSLGWCLALAASACAPATPTPSIFSATETPALSAETPTLAEITAPPATQTQTVAATPTQTLSPTAVIACANDSTFDSDITAPDGAQFLPGQTFVKKWSVKNSGTCGWGPGYRLVQVSGDALGAPNELALYPAKAGTTAIFEVPMTAPAAPGVYDSRWQARDPDGKLFGNFVTVTIEVVALPGADTPAP